MDFPLTREQLINYRTNVLLKEKTDARIKTILDEITSEITHTLKTTVDRRHVFNATKYLVFESVRLSMHDPPPDQQIVIKRVLEELTRRFPDSNIVLDALQKTITIDWSNQGPYDWKG